MRVFGMLVAVACSGVAVSGCTQTADTAYSDNRSDASRICLAAVSKRTGNGNVSVVRAYSRYQSTDVYVGVGPQRTQWRCVVTKNGPDSHYIDSIRKV